MFGFKHAGVAVLLASVFASGCTQKIEDKRASRQRYFLEKLILEPEEVDGQLRLRERLVVAHDGLGSVDVGSVVEEVKKAAPEIAEAAEEKESKSSVFGILRSSSSKKEKLIKTALKDDRVKDAIEMIKPNGELEGYAEAVYERESQAQADAATEEETKTVAEAVDASTNEKPADESTAAAQEETVATQDGLEIKYYLTSFPVDYLVASEVSASIMTRSMGEGANIGGAAKNLPAAREKAAMGKTEAEHHEKAQVVELKPVVIKPLLSDVETGRCGYAVMAHGLIVELRVPAGKDLLARGCAEEIARRVVREIETNHAILREVEQKRGQHRKPGDVGLDGFWGHMERHIDLENLEYTFAKIKF